MAVTSNTIIGHSSGKVGALYFSRWKGRNRITSNPQQPEYTRSIVQQYNTNKLYIIAFMWHVMKYVISYGMRKTPKNWSPINLFQSVNFDTPFTFDGTVDPDYNPLLLQLSKGNLPPTPITEVVPSIFPNLWEIRWDTAITGPQDANDNVSFAVFSPQEEQAIMLLNGYVRHGGEAYFGIPSSWAHGQPLLVYIFFNSEPHDLTSPTTSLLYWYP